MIPIPSIPQLNFLPYKKEDAKLNMHIDNMLLEQKKGWFLRLYGWDKPSLSIGKNTITDKKINLSFCEKNNIPYVRRITGGKSVLHHHEITYSLAGPLDSIPYNIADSCHLLSRPLLYALEKLAFPVQAKRQPTPLSKGEVCFQETSAYEITLFNKKLIGSAQVRKKSRFLQHGSILLKWDALLWSQIWNVPAPVLQKNIISLQEVTTDLYIKEKLLEILPQAFAFIFNTHINTV